MLKKHTHIVRFTFFPFTSNLSDLESMSLATKLRPLSDIYPCINSDCCNRLVFWKPPLICEAQEQAGLPYRGKADHQNLDIDWHILVRGRLR
jgi:hypothetical protein